MAIESELGKKIVRCFMCSTWSIQTVLTAMACGAGGVGKGKLATFVMPRACRH